MIARLNVLASANVYACDRLLGLTVTIATMLPHTAHEITEADLLRRAQSGNREALDQLIMLHEHRIFALALRMTGNLADAQDAVQETLIREVRFELRSSAGVSMPASRRQG
jgi:hypothetical protein